MAGPTNTQYHCSSINGPNKSSHHHNLDHWMFTGQQRNILLVTLATISIIIITISNQIDLFECNPLTVDKPSTDGLSTEKKLPERNLSVVTNKLINISSGGSIISIDPPIAETRVAKQQQLMQRRQMVINNNNLDKIFRERADDYPDHEINVILQQTPKELKELFNVDQTQLDDVEFRYNLTERKALHYIDNDYTEPNEESICSTVTRHIYPRQALRENSLVYVANTQQFKQVIKAEVCVDPDGECRYLQNSLPYGMISSCHQKFAHKKLLYLDELEKRMTSDLFRYPSCCSCVIRHTDVFDLRRSSSSSSSGKAKPSSNETSTTVSSVIEPSDSLILVNTEQPQRLAETRESKSRKEEQFVGAISTRDSLLTTLRTPATTRIAQRLVSSSDNKSQLTSDPLTLLSPSMSDDGSSRRKHQPRQYNTKPPIQNGGVDGGTIIVLKNNTSHTQHRRR